MIDPIGLVGTVIGIVQICNKVVSVCYEYRNGVRGATREISGIVDEVVSVGEIAHSLVQIADADHSSDLPSLHAMSLCDSTLDTCLAELVDFKTTLKLGWKVGLKISLGMAVEAARGGKAAPSHWEDQAHIAAGALS